MNMLPDRRMFFCKCGGLAAPHGDCARACWFSALNEFAMLEANGVGLSQQMDAPHEIAQCQARYPEGGE